MKIPKRCRFILEYTKDRKRIYCNDPAKYISNKGHGLCKKHAKYQQRIGYPVTKIKGN